MPDPRLATASSILAAFGVMACSDTPARTDAGPPQIVDTTTSVPPGAVLEGTWDGGPDDSLTISLVMPDPVLDWDIHTHDDGGTQTYIVELGIGSTSYTLRPSHSTTWYVLVKNAGTAVEPLTAHLELTAGTHWSGWP